MFLSESIGADHVATGVFVEVVDRLFDSFNSVKHADPGKKLCGSLSSDSPHIGHWAKAGMG
jgi:hypothetical protein